MDHESKINKIIELPDRENITLSEAVSAFVYGRAWDEAQRSGPAILGRMGFGSPLTVEQSSQLDILLERLNGAAYSGRIKFRALKNGESPIDGHKDIDPLYFAQQRGFEWCYDAIFSDGSAIDWSDVHLDRHAFVLLLRDMGVSVQQIPEADVPGERKTFRTGAAGRPTSMHFVLDMAKRRLDARDYPESKTKFSEELAAELKATEPKAVPIKPKTIRNSAEFKDLWLHKAPKKIDVS